MVREDSEVGRVIVVACVDRQSVAYAPLVVVDGAPNVT